MSEAEKLAGRYSNGDVGGKPRQWLVRLLGTAALSSA